MKSLACKLLERLNRVSESGVPDKKYYDLWNKLVKMAAGSMGTRLSSEDIKNAKESSFEAAKALEAVSKQWGRPLTEDDLEDLFIKRDFRHPSFGEMDPTYSMKQVSKLLDEIFG